MKKNLVMSIALLLLAALTCCGVTFAYFNASIGGGNNYIEVGNFVFDATSEIENIGDFRFKAATVINVPQIKDGAGKQEHSDYLTDGDDTYFDDYVIPVKITATNKSITPMAITAKLAAVPPIEGGQIPNYTANGAFQYFVFDSETTKKLNDSSDKNKYEKALREKCTDFESSLSEITDFFESTKRRLNLARLDAVSSMCTLPQNVLPAVDISGETPKFSSVELLGIMWLDWRGFKEALIGDRLQGSLNISVTVTATQFGQLPTP